ncbi:uncharacterized protein DNG_10481 [Cephalotrichum gorgonifer]|uniref:MARVEL domain-containing protein n=1 Tax=Cephalotrichum gorgonifer TaxID=2041049 RepID=A0AAE8T0B5_9PEZI|nr:uncharacterized protein DNG_10481 [Cephalotrichum gorgonifer]
MAAMKTIEPIFSPRFKLPVHLMQMVLAIVVIALSAARLLMKNAPRGRSTTMGIGMGAKSLVIILYQLLAQHYEPFRRWHSLKAYMILNIMEIVFWAAVAFMSLQANTKICIGTSCALGWVIFVVSIVLSMLAKYAAIGSYLDFRYFRANGIERYAKVSTEAENGQSLERIRTR